MVRVKGKIRAVTKETVVLEFEDGDMEGVRIVCAARASIRAMLQFSQSPEPTEDGGVRLSDLVKSNYDIAMRFGDDVLREWNLEDEDGVPLPATGEGCASIPDRWFANILNAWTEKLAGVPAPLETASGAGKPPAIPMTPMPESLQS